MKVLFYEPNHTGHHMPYLARMLPAFKSLPVRATIATTEAALRSEAFAKTVGPLLGDGLSAEPLCRDASGGRAIVRAARRVAELVRLVRRQRPDHAVVMYGDGLWQLLALAQAARAPLWPRGTSVEAILYRGGLAYPDATRPADRAKRLLFRTLVRRGPFDRLVLDDDLLFDLAQRHLRQGGPRIALAANPVSYRPMMDVAEGRRRLGLPEGGRVVSMSGMIDPRKGADLLVEAMVRHRSARPTDRLLLLGPHHDGIRALLETPLARPHVDAGGIVSIDRFVDEDEMFLAAAASDVVAATYPNHSGRSSLLGWAGAAGRKTLGSERGCIGHVIRTERLGWTVDPTDAEAFVAALGVALDAPWTASDVDRVRRFGEFHSLENYRAIATAGLRERLGGTVKASYRT